MPGLAFTSGFGATLTSEALPGALPLRQNSPHPAPHGLFPEQLNGTSFTVPRHRNQRTWLYRIRPAVTHSDLAVVEKPHFGLDYLQGRFDPNLLAWRPGPAATGSVDFFDGLYTIAGAGHPATEHGLAFYGFACNRDMEDRAFYSADGDLMLVPDTGDLSIRTELGWLSIGPGQIAVIPRGIVFSVNTGGTPARGFAVEIYGRHFELPERSVIGANGLADARHFLSPTAAYEDREVEGGFELLVKMGGALWSARRTHSPYDVVAWHGNYLPYQYDLSLFNSVGTVSWDHPDPSIYTVLTAPTNEPGENLADLVVFPSRRWDVAEHTFRPPYYHRNPATELNVIVTGPTSDRVYSRGGLFITPPFTAHGVNSSTVNRHLDMSDEEASKPERHASDSLWLQFETTLPLQISPAAAGAGHRDLDYRTAIADIAPRFGPGRQHKPS